MADTPAIHPFALSVSTLAIGGKDGFDLDEAMDTLRTVWAHRDDIVRVATKVPALLGEAGEFMHHAGQGAQRASKFLTTDVREIAGTAAHALSTSTAQLQNVLTVLENIGKALQQVPFLDDLGEMITNGIDAISGVTDNVQEVAGRVLALGNRLSDVGSDLDRVGLSLVGGGAMLADFGGKPVAQIAGFAGLPPIKTVKVTVRPVKSARVTKKSSPAAKQATGTTAAATSKKAATPKKAATSKKAATPKKAAAEKPR